MKCREYWKKKKDQNNHTTLKESNNANGILMRAMQLIKVGSCHFENQSLGRRETIVRTYLSKTILEFLDLGGYKASQMIHKPPWLYCITRRNNHSNLRRKINEGDEDSY